MKRLMTVYGVTCVLMILAALGASGTTIILPTDEQLIQKSPVILEGTVISSTVVEREGWIQTETVLSVERVIKGEAQDTVIIREIGGQIGERISKVFGSPEFAAGERVLVFLDPHPRGGFRTVDLFIGKFREGKTLNGRRLWLRDAHEDVSLLDSELREIESGSAQRDASAFEQFVEDRVAGRAGRKNYGVENPVLIDDAGSGSRGITSNFTLLSEPTVYRWSRFDSGQSAQWYSGGSQPGYANGGVSELQTAMGAWNNYTQAKIRYSYAGTRTGSFGGVNSPNGVNEVLFNDPLNEIAGTFSGNGTVGLGGFNGVGGSADWTAPFTADPNHTAGTRRATTINEGNLTIQNGVTASNISSSRLAEIIAHELGHTLGFGHSADSTALMYSSVTGRGPSLRADDQTAARWLYPNDSAPPPPPPQTPAAPSGLNGSVSGSNIDLTWTDNAGNETGQSIWLATGSGSFNKVADVGANVQSGRISGLSPDTYRIYVIASNTAGNSSPSNTTTETVAQTTTPLSASFSFSPSNPSTSTTVNFNDQSNGGPTSWSWSFGDGATSTAQNPSRRYTSAASYTVTLTVRRGSESKSTSRPITVSSSTPVPSPSAYHTLVSAAAQTNGIGGTAWRTELTIFNAGSQTANITLLYLPSAGSSVISRDVFLGPRQSAVYANALVDLFSISNGSGAIAIDATSAGATPQLHVTNRTYTDGGHGTFGQSVPTVAPAGLEKIFYLTAMQASSSYRTNVGLVNRSSQPVPVTLAVLDATGASVGSTSLTLPGNSFQQAPLAQLFPSITGRSFNVLSMRINATADDAISAYASVIDNYSQDPIYVQATPAAPGNELTLPVVGRAPGANGTFWRTDVTLFNPGSSRLSLSLRYEGSTKSLSLDGGDTMVLADVISSQFSRSSGTGALVVSWGGSSGPVVTSRTYTSTTTGGTFGQSIDPVSSFTNSAYVTGLRGNGNYRSNIGFVNGGGETETFQVILISSFGSELGRTSLTLAPGAQTQLALTAMFPGASSTSFTVQLAGDANAKLFAYGSMVDNLSGDPVFFAGQ